VGHKVKSERVVGNRAWLGEPTVGLRERKGGLEIGGRSKGKGLVSNRKCGGGIGGFGSSA
jgi:hypothetical protein